MNRIAVLVVGLAFMLLPASAFAQSDSSTCQAYHSETCDLSSDASLPFTGVNVFALAAGGGALLAAGFVIRRLSHSAS